MTYGIELPLVRLFSPGNFGASALSFRYFGPIKRFDHQPHATGRHAPSVHPALGVYYAGDTLSGCIVEVFGDTGVIDFSGWHVAFPLLLRPLRLLDLRGSGAMSAGTVTAMPKVANYRISQAWSRYFYQNERIYTTIDGIIYHNAHNDETAICLYERAADALSSPPSSTLLLNDLSLRIEILEVAKKHNLIVN